MEEYKIETGSKSHLQKILNQWKHEFTVQVISFTYVKDDQFAIIIKRVRK